MFDSLPCFLQNKAVNRLKRVKKERVLCLDLVYFENIDIKSIGKDSKTNKQLIYNMINQGLKFKSSSTTKKKDKFRHLSSAR